MSHRCGSNCRRKQNPSQRKDCPSCGLRHRLPNSITVDGTIRKLSHHVQRDTHSGITEGRIVRVLKDWVIRGDCIDRVGNRTDTYWGFVPGRKDLLRVVVSQEDGSIITAYPDDRATSARKRGNRGYFDKRCFEWEER